MNHEQMAILKSEISADPLGRGYSGMNDLEVANDLSLLYRSRNKEVPLKNIYQYAIIVGFMPTIEDAASDPQHASYVSAKKVVSMWKYGGTDMPLDISHPAFQAVMDDFVSSAIMTTGDRATINSMGTESVSRAAELKLPTVYEGNVQEARI